MEGAATTEKKPDRIKAMAAWSCYRIARKIRTPNFFCNARKTASAPRNAATQVEVSGTGAIGSPPAYSGESIDWRMLAKSGELDRPLN